MLPPCFVLSRVKWSSVINTKCEGLKCLKNIHRSTVLVCAIFARPYRVAAVVSKKFTNLLDYTCFRGNQFEVVAGL